MPVRPMRDEDKEGETYHSDICSRRIHSLSAD